MPFFRWVVGVLFLFPAISLAQDSVLLSLWPALFLRQDLMLTLGLIAVLVLVISMLVVTIRQMRRSDAQLNRSQALFEGVFDQSFQHIGIVDENGLLVSGNLALQGMIGHGQVKYDRPFWRWSCWHTEGAETLRQAFVRAKMGQITSFEIELKSCEQGIRLLEISFKGIDREDAEAGRQILFEARDITSRRQTEEKLRDSEVGYRLLYENQPVMLLAVDQRSRIQSVNQFAADLLGYSKRELLGHKVTDFYDGDEVPPQQIMAQSEAAETPVSRRELRYRTASGKPVWIRETIRIMPSNLQMLLVGEDITDNQELRSKLEYQASHDFLTHLFNRSYFESELQRVLKEVACKGNSYAMIYIDIDQFKVINDTAGHEAGDEALKQVALLLSDIAPVRSIISRLGGDEFAMLVPDCGEARAQALGALILDTLDSNEFFWRNNRFSFSASLGIRLIDHTAGSPQQVHAQADTACHAAKDEGRNRLHIYHPDDEELKRRELEMVYVNRIHDAIDEQRFELYAQQILPLALESKMHHYEILVRMRDTNGEMASPGVFLPAAERYNLAHLIDRYVVEHTLRWLASAPQALAQLELCSINLSGQSMGNDEFVGFLEHTIRSSPVPPQKLCLEITETAAIGNMSKAISLFSRLKKIGCQIALDDFGSGLSSFGYLKRIPVDIIKIDGMFVRDIARDEMDLAMVKAINDLAKTMGKKTVAEFVEGEEILAQLKELNVDYAQGYLIGKPCPLPELVAKLSQQHLPIIPNNEAEMV
ncbi:putative bifunctional diguanylate cyclase/phosphodiesterase [Thaumasiovibrio sp. DFM-14]|uniref:putative bifunctional diguanylate cyclase/phosphodiesterase n=1 Tax=Thaumasiovibrio sp. DFM-14 TaxID=3384792 RepID=UPI0039A109F3